MEVSGQLHAPENYLNPIRFWSELHIRKQTQTVTESPARQWTATSITGRAGGTGIIVRVLLLSSLSIALAEQ
jgi:hypothetical protein